MITFDEPAGRLMVAIMFVVVAAPVYLALRFFVGLVRHAYGFAATDADEGPPLRICPSCHNTVMEPDYAHCPYCGAELPRVEDAAP